ncbi:MAG: flippase-like domain-containing protein [Candidatus Eisenbacteria bacterium]|nr:flippase-like domain-containing protein [Candidatus Eisenbacteria bacterium]
MAGARRALLFLAKAVFSFLLLYLLLRGGTWERVVALARENFLAGPLVVALVAFAISNVLGGLQWHILLRGQGIRIGFSRAVNLYFVGLFFSNFLPANIGGDVVKIVDVYRSTGRGGGAVAATMMDRAIGLATLAAMSCAAGAAVLPALGPRPVLLLVPLFFLFFVGLCLMFLSRRVGALLLKLVRLLPAASVRTKGESILAAVIQYREKRRALIDALAVSIPVQALRILVHYWAALSLGIHVPPVYFFLFIPMIAVLIALPISINGIGVREGFTVLFFAMAGIDREQAFSISFLAFLVGVAVSLAGGVLYLVRTFQKGPRGGRGAGLRGDGESV